MRTAAVTSLLLLSTLMCAQQAVLLNGIMQVQPGTVLQFDGPITQQITANAQVINNGRIEFLNGASLDEAPGAPVIGSGTEHAWIGNNAAVDALGPGGLGLELSSADPIGPLELVRGHQPYTLGNGDQSIARWFKFETGLPAQLDQMILYFDATELNGSQATDLVMHDSQDASAPWVPMLSTVGTDQLSLIVNDHSPRQFITAFELNSTLEITEIADHGFTVFPSIFSENVNVSSSQHDIEEFELFDANGKLIHLRIPAPIGGRQYELDLSGCDQGPLFLRVNKIHTFKLIKL